MCVYMFLCVYTYYTDSNQNGLGLFIDLSVDDGDDLYDLEYWPWEMCVHKIQFLLKAFKQKLKCLSISNSLSQGNSM